MPFWKRDRGPVTDQHRLAVLDLETERTVDPAGFKTRAKFTPWAGETLRGWPLLTVVGGQVAYRRD